MRRTNPREAFWVIVFGLILTSAAGTSAIAEEKADLGKEACLECHGDPSAEKHVSADQFKCSAHGQMECVDCHSDITSLPHEFPLKTVHWQNIPATCGQCHEEIKESYLRSAHGKAVMAGRREAPVCTDCHGIHSIDSVKLASSRVSGGHIPETCGQCHAAERITTKYELPSHVVETYMDSIHGLSQQLGSVTVANCASCHGAHDILPSSDPMSSIHPANLAKTCGKCHAGVGSKVVRGRIHSGTRPGLEHRAVTVVRRFYVVLILLIVGGMLLHNGTDFLKKLWAHHRRMAALKEKPRMRANERIQHFILIGAFVSLAYTGFALKFPHGWWASPFMGRVGERSTGHQFAALIFCALAAYHAWFLLLTKHGRKELIEICPRRYDFTQFFQTVRYYLGLRPDRPVFGRYSYVEKAEYWALVWGSVIMVLTGAFMTWSSWTLQFFPKWFIDVVAAVHFYEAVLASLAIVIWHGYFTIFDPDEYPMKLTWITGENSLSDRLRRKKDDL